MRLLGVVPLLALLGGCKPEAHVTDHAAVAPPVESPNAIPDAPLNGTVHGTPFTVRDARYVVDRRVGYAHTDILLSSAKAESPCGPLNPARATSVWLRLEGDGAVEPKDYRIGTKLQSPWSVHYQVFDGDSWVGVSQGTALFSVRDATPDGHLTGGLAVCFSDDEKSCVSGSFDAANCPSTLDKPVRGAVAPEAIPPRFLQAVRGAASAAPPPPARTDGGS